MKFHVTQGGSIRWQDLSDPKFMNPNAKEKSKSFLERVYDEQKKFAPDGKGVRFFLVTPWQVHPDNELAQLISNTDGELRLDKLFKGGSKSKMGKIREAWKDHLGISNDEELKIMLSTIRINHSSENIRELTQRLNESLLCSGLKPMEAGTIVNPYVSLIEGLMIRKKKEFTKDELIHICKKEKLWVGYSQTNRAVPIGIRSFETWEDNMEGETKAMLCLREYFDERYIKEDLAWNNEIIYKIGEFLKESTRESTPYHLYLDVHSSIAFAAGYFLNPKSGVNIFPIQRYNGRSVWKPDNDYRVEDYQGWVIDETKMHNDAHDVVITLSATYNICDDVNYFIKKEKMKIGRIVNCTVEGGVGPNSIKNGTHAWILADKIATKINSRSFDERKGRLHIFSSVPNALMFFIGRYAKSFGQCSLYEFDFDKRTPGGYIPSISLPPVKK